MNEDKKTFLLQLIEQLQEGLIDISIKLEGNEDIETYDWERYEESIYALSKKLSDMKEEVEYS